jgi:hypothetical protein
MHFRIYSVENLYGTKFKLLTKTMISLELEGADSILSILPNLCLKDSLYAL